MLRKLWYRLSTGVVTESPTTIRVAVIGAGFVRTALLTGVGAVDSDVEVVAIASARRDNAQRVAQESDVEHARGDWRQMIRDQCPDLVVIATPTDLHAPMAAEATNAGAHVLCEKPMALEASEALGMLETSRRSTRIHMIDRELRFGPNYRKARQLITSGNLGEVRHVTITNISTSWGGPSSRSRHDWWSSEDRGGGRLGANGSHQIGLLRWWLGDVVSVQGHLRTAVRSRTDTLTGEAWEATADDVATFTLEMATGSLAQVFISGVARHPMGNHVSAFGSEGTLAVSRDEPRLLVGAVGEGLRNEAESDPDGGRPGVGPVVWNAGTVGLVRELLSAIRNDRPLANGATFEDGYKVQLVMDAVRETSTSGNRRLVGPG